KQAFEASTLAELVRMHTETTPVSPSSLVKDLDPAVERVILRCLDPDPLNRPASALAVAGALPGGDPLAAALAAGETPSPEMVAAAGNTEGLARKYSIPCLLAIALSMVLTVVYNQQRSALMRVPFDNSPEVLAHQ